MTNRPKELENIPALLEVPPCCFNDGSPAVARFSTPKGCVCYPEDREQDLCAQHIVKWGPLGDGVQVLQVYLPETARQLGIEATASEQKEGEK